MTRVGQLAVREVCLVSNVRTGPALPGAPTSNAVRRWSSSPGGAPGAGRATCSFAAPTASGSCVPSVASAVQGEIRQRSSCVTISQQIRKEQAKVPSTRSAPVICPSPFGAFDPRLECEASPARGPATTSRPRELRRHRQREWRGDRFRGQLQRRPQATRSLKTRHLAARRMKLRRAAHRERRDRRPDKLYPDRVRAGLTDPG